MKVKRTKAKCNNFQPFGIKITFQTQQEADVFYSILSQEVIDKWANTNMLDLDKIRQAIEESAVSIDLSFINELEKYTAEYLE